MNRSIYQNNNISVNQNIDISGPRSSAGQRVLVVFPNFNISIYQYSYIDISFGRKEIQDAVPP